MPGAAEFFKACGWKFAYTSYDLTRDLADYQTPPGVLERVAQQAIEVRFCTLDEAAAVLAFERQVFPSWAEFFERMVSDGHYSDILAAWSDNQVAGSLLVAQEDTQRLSPNGLWHQRLGDKLGTIGAVGVDEMWQERGIGLALVAHASENLKARGVNPYLIGWTDLLSFYGRLGYTPWCSYVMSEDR